MKKLFIGALALTMFAACSQDEIVEQQQLSSAITFDGTFVNNATRAAVDPSTTNSGENELKSISVWGVMDQPGATVFDEELVTKANDSWSYTNTQYWLPEHNYYFSAISPVGDTNVSVALSSEKTNLIHGIGTVSFTNDNGTTDLLYDHKFVSTIGKSVAALKNMDKVRFTMNHLLSKVKFTFTNGFLNENTKIVVKNIQMVVKKNGSIKLDAENWFDDATTCKWTTSGEETTTLAFGHVQNGAEIKAQKSAESDKELLTIPASAGESYRVTFDIEIWAGNMQAYTRSLETIIKGHALRMGYAYNFIATLDQSNVAEEVLSPIEFHVVEVEGWNEEDVNKGSIATTIVNVGSVEEFEAAAADGATNFKITNDLTITQPLNFGQTVTGGRSVFTADYVLDLNGQTIENKTGDAIVAVGEGVTLTINGDGNVKAATAENGASGNAVWAHGGAKVIINGGNYYVGSDKSNPSGNTRNDCIYAGKSSDKSAGTIHIYGGKFSVEAVDANIYNGQYWVLNLKDGTASEIKVYGGTFVNFDPSVNKSENPARNFVAPGYGVEINGNEYTVKELPAVSINVAAGATETLNSNVIIKGSAVVAGTLDGSDKKYTLFSDATDNGLIRPAGDATIKNLVIDGQNQECIKGEETFSLRGFYLKEKGTYNIENVTIKGCGYSLNCGGEGSPSEATLNVSNSTFEGWTSYTSTVTATFTNVKFTRGNYFANADQNGYFRPYGTTTLDGCEFALGFIVDFGCLAEGKTITFKNCTYNETALTAENIPAIWENYAEKAATNSVKFE